MRKRLGRFLPIVMLTVLVQLFAPVAIMRASAATMADPLAGAVICHNTGETNAADQSTDDQHHHSMCCPLCALAHAVTLFDQPPAHHLAIHRAYQSIAWLEGQPIPALSVFGSSQQARAPPFHS